MKAIRENVFAVGPSKSLVAAVAEPAGGAGTTTLPAIVILNTGIIHRVGHQRMFVILARELAARGYYVAAIDLRGRYREPFANWDAATDAPPARLRGDIALLQEIADAGLCRAAKDISQGGIVGTGEAFRLDFPQGISDRHAVRRAGDRPGGRVGDGVLLPRHGRVAARVRRAGARAASEPAPGGGAGRGRRPDRVGGGTVTRHEMSVPFLKE